MGPAATDQPAGHRAAMTPAEMNELIEQHIAAESAGDAEGAVAMYTDDVIHDVIGSPLGQSPFRRAGKCPLRRTSAVRE